jgi:hypothetical protein
MKLGNSMQVNDGADSTARFGGLSNRVGRARVPNATT